jgi:hypothetical protein
MSPALLLALTLQAADAPELADLRRAYEQSCVERAYGQFDDVCTQMSDQIRAYERDAARAAARQAREAARRPPAAPPAPPPPAADAGPDAAPGAIAAPR